MKSRKYKRITIWLATITLVVTAAALNPPRAKRIVCKVAVFFEIFKNVKECQFGCQCPKQTPRSKKKKQSKERVKAASFKQNCSTPLEYVFSKSNRAELFSFGLTHLALLTATWLAGGIWRCLLGKK